MTDGLLVNWGVGPHYADGWVNIDAHEGDGNTPDVVVDAAAPFATFADGTVERVYAGHVLEHCPLDVIPHHLAEVRRVLVSGGEFCVVGPDVYETLRRWKDGKEPWSLVETVLEGADEATGPWPEATHRWNCRSDRVEAMLNDAGFDAVKPVPLDSWELDRFPLTSRAPWQMACIGTNP